MSTTSNIEKHDLPLPNKADAGKLAFFLLNVFTPKECQQWIDMTEKLKSHRNPWGSLGILRNSAESSGNPWGRLG
jgi:hypothetical protein